MLATLSILLALIMAGVGLRKRRSFPPLPPGPPGYPLIGNALGTITNVLQTSVTGLLSST